MNLVDSCGWLEYFADSSYADFYASAVEDTSTLIVPCLLAARTPPYQNIWHGFCSP